MEQVANGVVHPVTQETITNYKKPIDDPLLKRLGWKPWQKYLADYLRGTKTQKNTNTVEFMDFEEITQIRKGKMVTYARIVVDYRPQKKTKTECE